MNQVVLMGRLTATPELRHTPSGTAVTTFTLAVDRGYTPKDGGERQTDFIDIVAWRNTADFVTKYFTKGQMAAVVGRLQIRSYTDKDGIKRKAAEVVADNVYFTESKKSREASGGYSYSEPKSDSVSGYQTPVTGSDFAELEEDDGDLPF
jgi:single-strand DNA-binding protein